MKISIITVTYNSAATLAHTLESVNNQDYADIEHVLVDGGSKDETVSIIQSYPHVAKWVSEKDNGLYDAINKGIQMATGDVIGILNSDDFFPGNHIVSLIARTFKENNVAAVYGDIAFVRPGKLEKIVRLYSSQKFTPRRFGYGYMPAHPSFYTRKSCYDTMGLYKLDYKIAADYELLMRFIFKNGISHKYIPETLVYMRTGGVSNKNILSRYTLNKEIIKACKENGVNTNMALLSLKYINKVFEYIKPAIAPGRKK
ncbi:MAG: glycosyltransferase family 2 protein [Chitinophagaceae bacterium]